MSSVQPQVPIVHRQGHPPIVANQPSKYTMSQKVAGAFAILGAIFAFLSPALGAATILTSLLIFSVSCCSENNTNQNSNIPAATARVANGVILLQQPAPSRAPSRVVLPKRPVNTSSRLERKTSQPGAQPIIHPTGHSSEGKASRPCASMTGPVPHNHPPLSLRPGVSSPASLGTANAFVKPLHEYLSGTTHEISESSPSSRSSSEGSPIKKPSNPASRKRRKRKQASGVSTQARTGKSIRQTRNEGKGQS